MDNEKMLPHRGEAFFVGPPGPSLFSIYLIISDYKNGIVKMTVKITAKCLAA
jgi:hypothetical protein